MVTLQPTVRLCLSQWGCSQGKIRKCCHNPKRFVQTEKCLGTEIAEVETKPGGGCVQDVGRRYWGRVQWGCTPWRCLQRQDAQGSRVSLAHGEGSAKKQDFAQFWLVLFGVKLPFISLRRRSALCLGPVPVWCRQGSLLIGRSPAQRLGAPWASQLLAGGVGEPRGWHDPA